MSDTPDPLKFPKPHGWATWARLRMQQFKTHRTVGMAKAALTSLDLRVKGEAWVYQFDPNLDQWVEFAHVHDGDRSFFDVTNAKRKPKEIPQKRVDEAIALIQEAMARRRKEGA